MRRQPSADFRSIIVVRRPNGSGVTPRIQSSMRATTTVTKMALDLSGPSGKNASYAVVQRLRISRFPSARFAFPVRATKTSSAASWKTTETLVGATHVGHLGRVAIGDEAECPLILVGVARNSSHRPGPETTLVVVGYKPTKAHLFDLVRSGSK